MSARTCAMKGACTTGQERRVTRWEHEDVLGGRASAGLDGDPRAMRVRRETVEHPFGTLKARMGATHFLTKTLPRVSTRWHFWYWPTNLTRVSNFMGSRKLLAAIPA